VKTITDSDTMLDITSFNTSSATLLPLESPTICADIIADFDEENRKLNERQIETALVRENAKLAAISMQEIDLILDEKRMSPIGSEDLRPDEKLSYISGDESDPDSHATYNVNSPRRPRIVKPVIRKVINNLFIYFFNFVSFKLESFSVIVKPFLVNIKYESFKVKFF